MILKKVVLDLKGNIKPDCVTAEGMEAMFGEKVVSLPVSLSPCSLLSLSLRAREA